MHCVMKSVNTYMTAECTLNQSQMGMSSLLSGKPRKMCSLCVWVFPSRAEKNPRTRVVGKPANSLPRGNSQFGLSSLKFHRWSSEDSRGCFINYNQWQNAATYKSASGLRLVFKWTRLLAATPTPPNLSPLFVKWPDHRWYENGLKWIGDLGRQLQAGQDLQFPGHQGLVPAHVAVGSWPRPQEGAALWKEGGRRIWQRRSWHRPRRLPAAHWRNGEPGYGGEPHLKIQGQNKKKISKPRARDGLGDVMHEREKCGMSQCSFPLWGFPPPPFNSAGTFPPPPSPHPNSWPLPPSFSTVHGRHWNFYAFLSGLHMPVCDK